VGMIVSPRKVFQGLNSEDAWLWPAIMLLVGYMVYYIPVGLQTARFSGGMFGNILTNTPTSADQSSKRVLDFMASYMPAFQLFSMVAYVPFAAALSWATRTVCFTVLGRMLSPHRPPVGRVIAMIGWAWVPILFQYVGVGLAMLFIPEVTRFLMPMPDIKDAQMNVEALNRNRWQAQMLLELSPFVIWNIVLCVIGVSEVFKLPRWKSAIVVLVPTAAQVLFQLAIYFLSQSMLNLSGGMANPTVPPPGR